MIVGAGPLGWACSHLLATKNIRSILIDPNIKNTEPAWLQQGLGVFWPSLNDPPTRTVVAHGTTMAQWLQQHCRQGLEQAKLFLPGIQLQPATCLRIGVLPHEIEELNRACELNLGINKSDHSAHIYTDNCDSLIHVARKNSQSLTFNKKYLSSIQARVISLAESQEGCLATLESGEEIASEMVILANGFQISELQPWLKVMLVPMSDIETFWRTNIACSENETPITLRAASGHVAAALIPEEKQKGTWTWTVRMTGPRFMLPRAGVGIDLCGKPVDELLVLKTKDWLKTQLIPCLGDVIHNPPAQLLELELISSRFGVDCLPCDELPILGDLGQSGRILASTGWLACGWSASFQSASILSEIIESGRSAKLAPLLRPRRWRSGMSEDGVTGMT